MTAEALDTDLALVQGAIKNDDPDLAEKLLRNILKTEKNNPFVHRLLGSVLLKTGFVDAAIGEFTTALQIDPQDELARDYLFSVYYNRAQDFLEIPLEAYKARGELEKAIAIRPDGIMSYYFLGTLDYQENRDTECIAMLLKVADIIPEMLRPNLHTMLYNSAFNLLNQNRADDAKEVLPYFFNLPQATINELLLTATISLEVGDFIKSTELYDRVLSKDPLHTLARYNRGIAQQRLDEIRRQEAAAALLQKQNPESPPAENLSKSPVALVTGAP
jgi:tetratricopeptide (TPR) repeat protein